MKAKDFLKSKKIWLGTTVADMNQYENYFNLEDLLEEYHQAKLKLLDIPVVSKSYPCCDGTGKCEGQHYDDIQPCLTCGGSGHVC